MEWIEGGVCAAKGFQAGAVHCGIKASQKKTDVALIVSDCCCAAAAVYTNNLVKAAPLHVTRSHLTDGRAQAIIANSGNANACAPNGEKNAKREAKAAAKLLGLPEEEVLVASTGVIGQELPVACIEQELPQIQLSYDGSEQAAQAIMTTDTKMKTCAVQFELNGTLCHLGGICKGSGMIHPNMGTMLCFLTTDAKIASNVLEQALRQVVRTTFNRVTVDGDTSTNDMCVVMANGLAGNPELKTPSGAAYDSFFEALHAVTKQLAKRIAADGEGASRLISCTVSGARNEQAAETLAKAICGSALVKTAMFGADANWGRVLCAMGYSGEHFDAKEVSISFASKAGSVTVCEKGRGIPFSEAQAKQILSEDEVEICAALQEGSGSATCWGCDLTYGYVKINGDYRT